MIQIINFIKNYFNSIIYTKGEKKNNLNKIFLEQVIKSGATKVAAIIISLLNVPLVLGYLEPEKFGIWTTINTIVNWIVILDIGMGSGLRNKLGVSIAKKQLELGRTYVSNTYAFIGFIFLFFLLVFHIVNPFLNWQIILNTTYLSKDEIYKLTSLIVTFVVLRFIVQTVSYIDTAHGDSSKSGILQLTSNLVSTFIIYLLTLYSKKGDLLLLATAVVVPPVIIYIIYSFFVFNFKYRMFKPTIKSIDYNHARDLIGISLKFFVVSFTALIIYASTPFLITQLFGPIQVAIYNVAFSIFNLPIMLIGIVCTPILPLVTQAYAKGDFIWLKSTLRILFCLSLLISVGTLILIFTSNWIYRVWVGEKIIIPFNLTVVIGIYSVISILNTPFSNFINGMGKVSILTKLAPFFVVIYLGFSYILARVTHNIVSVPIALIITSLVGLIVVVYTVLKNLNFKRTNISNNYIN